VAAGPGSSSLRLQVRRLGLRMHDTSRRQLPAALRMRSYCKAWPAGDNVYSIVACHCVMASS
jgi:hypothetical protein